MKRYIEGESREQMALLPECLEDYIAEENPIRAIEVFIANWIWVCWDSLDLSPQ